MADFPAAIRNRLMDYIRGAGAPTAISNIYLELFNGDPQGAGTSVQNTITGSANRTLITSALGASASGTTTNAAQIVVAASASGGATVTHLAFYDAITSGNLLASHVLTSGSLVVTATNPVNVPASGIALTAA